MANKYTDTSLFDKAMIFAVKAHANTERRGKGFPYIVHCMEAVEIVATMTNDPEMLAAAALHDTVEDTPTTVEDIRREFGDRVAELVDAESEKRVEGSSPEDTWHARKETAMRHLANAPLEVKIVAMGDKLSNLRGIARDFSKEGNHAWEKFHCKDPHEHAWRWRGLLKAFSGLENTTAYVEFSKLVNYVFSRVSSGFSFDELPGDIIMVEGVLDAEGAQKIVATMAHRHTYTLNFAQVPSVKYSAIRTLLNARKSGLVFFIVEATRDVAQRFETTGAASFISIMRSPRRVDMSDYKESGDGFTAISYFKNDGDSMMKLYYDFMPTSVVEREKRIARAAFIMGIPTPMSGDIVHDGRRNGITFERVLNKRSFARIMSEEPERLEELATTFAAMTKKLHETPCDTAIFPNVAELYHKFVDDCDLLEVADKVKVHAFINAIPASETCVHGDLHMGNVITNGKENLFIDMSDFGWGNPWFDIGMLYIITKLSEDHMVEKYYHVDRKAMNAFWAVFVREYFGATTPEQVAEVEEKASAFAALKMVYFSTIGTNHPLAKQYIDKYLLS